jgi:hypothetical protein
MFLAKALLFVGFGFVAGVWLRIWGRFRRRIWARNGPIGGLKINAPWLCRCRAGYDSNTGLNVWLIGWGGLSVGVVVWVWDWITCGHKKGPRLRIWAGFGVNDGRLYGQRCAGW